MYTKLARKIRNCQLHRPRKPHIPRFAHRPALTHSAVPSLQTGVHFVGPQFEVAFGIPKPMLRQFRSHAGDETDQPSEWDGQQEEHQRKEGHRDHRREVQNRKPEPTEHQHPELMKQIDAKA